MSCFFPNLRLSYVLSMFLFFQIFEPQRSYNHGSYKKKRVYCTSWHLRRNKLQKQTHFTLYHVFFPFLSARPDPCKSNPCGGHGKCTSSADGADFTCACDRGYAGKTCDEDKNECTSSVKDPCPEANTFCLNLDIKEADKEYECPCLKGFARRFAAGSVYSVI